MKELNESLEKMAKQAYVLAKTMGDSHQCFVAKMQLLLIKATNDCTNEEYKKKDFSACENIIEQLEKIYEDIING